MLTVLLASLEASSVYVLKYFKSHFVIHFDLENPLTAVSVCSVVSAGLQGHLVGGKRSGSAWCWSQPAPQLANLCTVVRQTAHQRAHGISAKTGFRKVGKC